VNTAAPADKVNTAAPADKVNILWLVNLVKKDALVPKMEFVTVEKVAHVLPAINELIPKI
jgi:hypothetical protein